jgi:hypothetical protein
MASTLLAWPMPHQRIHVARSQARPERTPSTEVSRGRLVWTDPPARSTIVSKFQVPSFSQLRRWRCQFLGRPGVLLTLSCRFAGEPTRFCGRCQSTTRVTTWRRLFLRMRTAMSFQMARSQQTLYPFSRCARKCTANPPSQQHTKRRRLTQHVAAFAWQSRTMSCWPLGHVGLLRSLALLVGLVATQCLCVCVCVCVCGRPS